jgi:hypothetical protein
MIIQFRRNTMSRANQGQKEKVRDEVYLKKRMLVAELPAHNKSEVPAGSVSPSGNPLNKRVEVQEPV